MHSVRPRLSSFVALLALLTAPLGLVALTAAPAGAVDVTTAAQYLDAFNDPGEVDINVLNDITFPCPAFASRAGAGTVTVHGNGHAIHTCPASIGHSAAGSNLVFESVVLDGSSLIVSVAGGDITLIDSQITSVQSVPILGISDAGGDITLTRSQVGPLTAPNINGVSDAGGSIFAEGSTIGPMTATAGPALGLSLSGDELSLVDTVVTSIRGTVPTNSVSIAADVTVTRSTITDVERAALVGEQVNLENSTYSNNEGSLVIVSSNGSVVYSDIVENAAAVAPGALVIPDLPALPDDAPEGLTLAAPDLSAVADVGPAQGPAQLVLEGEISFFGTVVALPLGGAQNCDVVLGAASSNGYNFSDDDTCDFSDATDQEDAGDPLLGPLADNGGPTPTRLPLTGSPLINVIPLAACEDDGAAGISSDQRGLPRPAETGCEIGSVELQPPPTPEPIVLEPTFTG